MEEWICQICPDICFESSTSLSRHKKQHSNEEKNSRFGNHDVYKKTILTCA